MKLLPRSRVGVDADDREDDLRAAARAEGEADEVEQLVVVMVLPHEAARAHLLLQAAQEDGRGDAVARRPRLVECRHAAADGRVLVHPAAIVALQAFVPAVALKGAARRVVWH